MSNQSQEIQNEESIEGDWRAEFIADYLLPGLPSPKWYADINISEEELEKSRYQLAKTYLSVVNPGLTGLALVFMTIVFLDTLVNINPISYGLAMSVWASMVMVVPSLKNPSIIASVSEGNAEVVRRLQAEEMAYNNVGFALLGLGFIVQILGLHTDSYFIETALLSTDPSSIAVTAAIFVSVLLPIYTPNRYHRIVLIAMIISLGYLHLW